MLFLTDDNGTRQTIFDRDWRQEDQIRSPVDFTLLQLYASCEGLLAVFRLDVHACAVV